MLFLNLTRYVANWLSVVNVSSSTKAFRVRKYNQAGALLNTEPIALAPFARVDTEVR